ncbi:MAG TPA: hypothetical protein VEG30_11200 [Terriglobales bacterium]|nr:hypothetical protein [Terriglobales bacterium]
MRKLALVSGVVLLLFGLVGIACAQLPEYCLYTKTKISPSVANVNGKESFDVTTLTKSVCGFPIYEGVACIYDSFTSLTQIDCEELDDWGKAYFTVHKGEYVNFSGSIPTQYIQGRFFDEEDVVWEGVKYFFYPSITNPGTLVCVGCASGF